MQGKGKKLDLTGQRYGRLTVLQPGESIAKKTTWLCQCDCGTEVVVKTRNLRNGHVKSCGCLQNKWVIGSSLNYIDGTCVEMLQAKTVRKNNTSGVAGVEWQKERQRWRASICFKGKRYYLGSYINFTEAVAARKQAEANLHDLFLENIAQSL